MGGELVLVVEDNERNMKLLRDLLHAAGYRPLEASTGRQALQMAVEQRPALVLMDVRLPDLGGVEVLDGLRADQRTAAIPVLAVTAQAMRGDRERFREAGFDGYLPKPVDIDDLLATVAHHCRRRGRWPPAGGDRRVNRS
jgi:two-component system, cell cycle response regulator DivK